MKEGAVNKRTYDNRYESRRWVDKVCTICGAQAQIWASEQGGVGIDCSNSDCGAILEDGKWRFQ